MSYRPLPDLLVLALVEHGPTSCVRLARIVGRRDFDVRRSLRADPRFRHVGRTSGSRWYLVPHAEWAFGATRRAEAERITRGNRERDS